MAEDIVLNKLKDHADLVRHVEDAGWKLRIGNRGPEVAPNLFQDAVDLIEAQQAEIERLRAALALADQMVDALQVAFDPSLGEESHDTIFGVWQEAQSNFAAYEEARRER